MNTALILTYAIQFSLLIATFSAFFIYALWRGRQSVINIVIGLMLGLLLYSYFPYQDWLVQDSPWSSLLARLLLFSFLTAVSVALVRRLMLPPYEEGHFESFGKKILLAGSGTIIILLVALGELGAERILLEISPYLLAITNESLVFWWLLLVGFILWYAS